MVGIGSGTTIISAVKTLGEYKMTGWPLIKVLFVLVEALCPSQQFFGHVGTFSTKQ